ncbi:hypothetical protein [Bacillus stercoris]|uniref:DUF3169 family protein n=1 Tax=Bacillus stercoris TaxID=2054641 RepID=A0ABU0VA17_9BACI|nr:hypothetical protein [Bacillus stercoris]MDQ1853780.1 hypothetical protein [Bacillus stercoris]
MTSGTVIGLISGAAALTVGTLGGVMGSAFNRQILNSIGVHSLPQNPKRKYSLIAKHCRFLVEWNRFDSYNVFVFFLGILFLIGAGVLLIVRFETGGTPFQDTLQLAFLVNSLTWISVSSILLLGRLVQLIHIYKYGIQHISKEETAITKTQEQQNKNKFSLYWIIILAATILFIGGGLQLLQYPVGFLSLAGAYFLFMFTFNSVYHKNKRK